MQTSCTETIGVRSGVQQARCASHRMVPRLGLSSLSSPPEPSAGAKTSRRRRVDAVGCQESNWCVRARGRAGKLNGRKRLRVDET